MKIDEKVSTIEAILFASGEPISVDKLAFSADIEISIVEKLVRLLQDRYEDYNSAIEVLKLGDSYQLATKEKFSQYIKTALQTKKNTALSAAALEVLTIVAYNQPVTKSFVEHVRGVDSSYIMNSLTEKDLLEEAGRLDVPGKPISYKTTNTFLRCFRLGSIEELPPLPKMNEQVSFNDIEDEEVNEVLV